MWREELGYVMWGSQGFSKEIVLNVSNSFQNKKREKIPHRRAQHLVFLLITDVVKLTRRRASEKPETTKMAFNSKNYQIIR